MYCIHCGEKNPPKAAFCSACGKAINSSQPEPGKEEIQKVKKPKNPVVQFFFQFFLFSIMLVSIILTNSASELSSNAKSFLMLSEAIVLLMIFIFMIVAIRKPLFKLSKRSFWYLIKHPKTAGAVAVAIVVLVFVIKNQINNYQYNQALDSLESIQETLTPIFLSRTIGNDIQNNRGYPYGWSKDRITQEIGHSAEITSSQQTPSFLIYYIGVVNTWGIDILDAAAGDKKWTEVSDQPPSFTLMLTDDQAAGFFAKSIKQISSLKQFGDSAIARGDRQTMRVIAAKLLLQQHFLDNLSLAKTPFLVFVPIAYAAGGNRNPCIKEACLNNMLKIMPGVWRTALGYAAGEPKAAQEWQDSWQQASKGFEQTGYLIGGTGITQGESDQAKNPPLVQAFFDSCSAEGGTIGDTGGVKTRLPTSEDGYTCWQTKANGKCWKFLTYSGGSYAGGDAGVVCPEKNLLPPPPPSPSPAETLENNNEGNSGRRVCPASAPVDCGNGCCPYGEGGRTDVCCPGGKCVTGGKCPSSGGGGGGSSSACPQQSQISGCGTIPPSCNCPANCPNHFIITNAPRGQEWIKGYKQCTP